MFHSPIHHYGWSILYTLMSLINTFLKKFFVRLVTFSCFSFDFRMPHPPPYYPHFVPSISFVKVTLWTLFIEAFIWFGAYKKGPRQMFFYYVSLKLSFIFNMSSRLLPCLPKFIDQYIWCKTILHFKGIGCFHILP